MEFKQIRRKKIYEEVAEQIKGMIEQGSLAPGDKLASVRELAERFNVGRSAVREALSALRAIGLLEMRQGEGTFIRPFDAFSLSRPIASAMLMSQEQILHLVELRKVLETGSAGICADRRRESDLAAMEAALADMAAGLDEEEGGGERAERADVAFHFAIARGTRNDLLIEMMETVSGTMHRSIGTTRRLWVCGEEASAQRLLREHRSIYEAIRDQNATAARERMLMHLVKVEETLCRAMTGERGDRK